MKSNLTEAQRAALVRLHMCEGNIVVIHVGIGDCLEALIAR